MRYRTVKPDFWISEQISNLSFPARLLFIGLWCVSDRNGIFKNKNRSLKVQIFPFDDVDVDVLLQELCREMLIVLYEYENESLGYIPSFSKHQFLHKKEPSYNYPLPTMSGQVMTSHDKSRKQYSIGSDLNLNPDLSLKEGVQGEFRPVKVRAPKSSSIPKYQLPDRSGNERELVAGCECLWASEAELVATFEKLTKAGLRPQFHEKALLWVDTWLKENPGKLAVSSEHCARILTWGLRESLKLQQEYDRAMRAESVNKAPAAAGYQKESNLSKTRRVLYGNGAGNSSTTRVPISGVRDLPDIPGESSDLVRTLAGLQPRGSKESS